MERGGGGCQAGVSLSPSGESVLPENVIHPHHVLLTGVLDIDGDGGTRLDPHEAAILLEPAVILGYHLALV